MFVRLLRFLTAGVIFAFAAGAQAQVQDPKLWYFTLGGGAAWYESVDFGGGADASLDTGFSINGAVGRYIDDIRVVRLELEGIYDRANADNVSGVPSSGTLYNAGAMFNAYYDFRTNSSWTPYFGGGLGYSRVEWDNLTVGTATVNDSDDVFSWQIKAGVTYEISPSWEVNVNYRYYGTDNLVFADSTGARVTTGGTRIHNAEIGFRLNF